MTLFSTNMCLNKVNALRRIFKIANKSSLPINKLRYIYAISVGLELKHDSKASLNKFLRICHKGECESIGKVCLYTYIYIRLWDCFFFRAKAVLRFLKSPHSRRKRVGERRSFYFLRPPVVTTLYSIYSYKTIIWH
jgi:hypothetical protein